MPSECRRCCLTVSLLGSKPRTAGWIDVTVDRRSVLGNPFYDAAPPWMWLTDCVAYRRYLIRVLDTNTETCIKDDESLNECAASIADSLGVSVASKWRRQPPTAALIRSEIARLQALLHEGAQLRLLCHCTKPFPELGGQFSPCHVDTLSNLLDPIFPISPSPAGTASALAVRPGNATCGEERIVAFPCDCAGLRRDCEAGVEALLQQLPSEADPYRGRRAGELRALPGGLTIRAPATSHRRTAVLFAQIVPGRPPTQRGGPWSRQLQWAAEACGCCEAAEDSEAQRAAWLEEALARLAHTEDLESVALPRTSQGLGHAYLQVVDAFARAMASRNIQVTAYGTEDD